jgi:hypothetical protein
MTDDTTLPTTDAPTDFSTLAPGELPVAPPLEVVPPLDGDQVVTLRDTRELAQLAAEAVNAVENQTIALERSLAVTDEYAMETRAAVEWLAKKMGCHDELTAFVARHRADRDREHAAAMAQAHADEAQG